MTAKVMGAIRKGRPSPLAECMEACTIRQSRPQVTGIIRWPGSLTLADARQGGVRLEGGKLVLVGLFGAEGDFKAERGQRVLALLEEPQGFVDHGIFGGIVSALD